MTWFSGRRARSVATTPHRDPPGALTSHETQATARRRRHRSHRLQRRAVGARGLDDRSRKPPVARGDAVCSDGMDFKVATYVSSVPREPLDVPTIRFPPNSDLLASRDPITLANLGVWVDTPDGGVEASPVVDPLTSHPVRAAVHRSERDRRRIGTWPGGPGNFTHSVSSGWTSTAGLRRARACGSAGAIGTPTRRIALVAFTVQRLPRLGEPATDRAVSEIVAVAWHTRTRQCRRQAPPRPHSTSGPRSRRPTRLR